jgi:hypothetical protein
MNQSDKILISCISAIFVTMIWIAKPPKSTRKKSLLGVKDGRALLFLRPAVSVLILIINICVWAIH